MSKRTNLSLVFAVCSSTAILDFPTQVYTDTSCISKLLIDATEAVQTRQLANVGLT